MAEKREAETLGDMLLREGIISRGQLDEAVKRQKAASEKSVGQILVEMGVITESVKMSFLKKKFGYEFFTLGDKKVDLVLLSYIPKHYAEKYHVVPVGLDKGVLIVAMDDPSDLSLLDNLKTTVGMPIRPVITSATDIDDILKLYPEGKEEYIIITTPPSTLYRTFKYLFLPVLGFFPLLVFIGLLNFSEGFVKAVTKITQAGSSFSFDVFLYTLLGWGLWITIIWEINGLIFEPKGIPKPPPPSEEPEE
jgi:hypothetical protein